MRQNPDGVLLVRVIALFLFGTLACLTWQFSSRESALTWTVLALIWLAAVIHRCIQLNERKS